ncbi:F-box/kelch-repeat protein [Carex littledalei]|uniref:F-box/kelch-repeat protein n=1 Tax=Carex littledalei TaxID=544730 RepID=A0A833QI44_9POAL|nr:F-box/kelch-repeat protein [Carex littledalei]
MNVDSSMAKEHESWEDRSRIFYSSEVSSAQAADAPYPHGLTPEALIALGQEGSQVLVYSGSRRMMFHGSKAIEGNSATRCLVHPACSESTPIGEVVLGSPVAPSVDESDDTDIFADVDPDYHMLIVHQELCTMRFWRPTEDMVLIIKGVIARCLRTNGIFAEFFPRANLKRKQLLEKEGGSCKRPNVKLPSTINNSSLIVIKKVSGTVMCPSNCRPNPTLSIELMMKRAREKDESCAMAVVFVEWKLSTPKLSPLPLVPSLHSDLPWFYLANPGTSQGNHIFGNITARQSFLVANSGLQSSSRLMYSKDGWLLLRGQEPLYVGRGSPRSPRHPVFLLNPITGARIDLPSFRDSLWRAAFFTTTQGTPRVVVYVCVMGSIVRVYMVRPGGAYWEEHPYVLRHGEIGTIKKTLLCGGSVYFFFTSHTLIFKLADLSWHLLTGGSLKHGLVYYEPVEVEGKVVVVGHPEYFTNPLLGWGSVPFFRMEISGDEFNWLEITGSDAEFDGCIWFIHRRQSFCVKTAGSGQKICWFAPRGLCAPGFGTAYALHCLNLTTRAHCKLTADSVFSSQHAWVDLSCPSDPSLLDRGITGDDLLPGF